MKNRKLDAHGRVEALAALSAGESVESICATRGISTATLYNWKKDYAGLSAESVEKFDALSRENADLHRQVVIMELNVKILQDALSRQLLEPDQKRALIDILRTQFNVSLSRVSNLLHMSRSFYSYEALRKRRK